MCALVQMCCTTPFSAVPHSTYTFILAVQFLQKQHLMDYSLLVGIHQCKRYPPSAEDEEDGDDEGSEESDCVAVDANDGTIVEEDEDSAGINGDNSSEGFEG